MSERHPIVAITGSSGAGTSIARRAFEYIFEREGLKAASVGGDGFHRYERPEMDKVVEQAAAEGRNVTHFGPEGNLFDELENLFKEFGETGRGKRRHYVHDEEEQLLYGRPPGHVTPWEPLPDGADLLFYEGLHGAVVTDTVDVARHVDLLIGVTPTVNLEWIQKIHRDRIRGYSLEAVTHTIVNRMADYVRYIVPQFSRTDINFQRVPLVDTSNPFAASAIPSTDESLQVIFFRDPKKLRMDFRYLLEMLEGSFMSNSQTLIVPAGKQLFAMEIIIAPLIERLMYARSKAMFK
jgi:phosphoribulokinase